MGNFAPDGLTYYLGQSFRGIGGFMYIVDLADPSNLKQLPTWQFLSDGRPTAYGSMRPGRGCTRATRPVRLDTPSQSSYGRDGLVILDVSDYQFRLSSLEFRIVSKLFWEDQGQVEEMYHFRNGRHYIVSSDESGGQSGVGGLPAACAREGPRMVIRISSTSPTRGTLRSSPNSCSK